MTSKADFMNCSESSNSGKLIQTLFGGFASSSWSINRFASFCINWATGSGFLTWVKNASFGGGLATTTATEEGEHEG
jgi:hypothetical protein